MAINSSNDHMAARSIEIPNEQKTVISFYAELAAATSSHAALNQLTISNSFRQCRTIANKIAAFAPIEEASTEVDPISPNNLATNSSSNATALAREAFIGD